MHTRILILTVFLLLAACGTSTAPPVNPWPQGAESELLVEVSGIEQPDGFIAIAVFAGKDSFPSQPFEVGMAAIVDGSAQRPFRLPPGEYAVLAFQDQNSNGKLDRHWFGLPSEPYATSGERRRFGPPSWKHARFDFPRDSGAIRISLGD